MSSTKVINTILNLKNNFSDTIENVAKSTSNFRNGMQKTEKQALSMKKTVSDAFGDIGKTILDGVGIGAGMEIFETIKDKISETVTFGSDLQSSLNGVMASGGLASSGADRMKDIMLDIYNNNFGENFGEIGEALKAVGQQTGYTGDNLKDLTENALTLKDTFDFEVGESTRSASTLMKNFGIDGNEAFNLIAQGKQDGLDFSGEMLDSINEYSVQFKKVGLNAEDMFNVFKSGTDNGAFNIDKIGDAVKEFSIRSIDGSTTSIDGFTQLGFNADELTGKFAKGGDTAKSSFQDVIKALTNMKDPVKQSQVGVELFGTQFEDLGITAISSLGDVEGEISNTYDALGQINKVKYNDIGSAFEGIKRNIQTSILIPISDAVLPRLNDFASWFSSNIPNIKENISSMTTDFLNVAGTILDKNLPAIQNLGGAISDLVKTIWDSVQPAFDSIKPTSWDSIADAIKNILDKATEVVNFIKDNWKEIEPVVLTIVGALTAYKLTLMAIEAWSIIVGATTSIYSAVELAIWGVVNATSAWEAIQWLLNVAMDANPVGFVIGVIALLGLAIYEVVTHFQDIVDWCYKAWAVLEDNPILGFIATIISPLGVALLGIITHWKDICDWVQKAWDWLKKWNDTTIEDKNVNINQTITQKQEQGSGADFMDTFNASYDVGANATGSNFWRGGFTKINEHGGEMALLPSGSKVIPADKTNKILNGNGGHTFIINFNGNVGTEEFFDKAGDFIVNKVTSVLQNNM